MSGSGSYNIPGLQIPYTMPSGLPLALQPIIQPIYVAFQNIIQTLVNYGGVGPRNPGQVLLSNGDPTAILANNVHRFYCQASEGIAEGALINLWDNGIGVITIRNANATTGSKPCDGFCSQSGGIAIGAIGEVILNDGVIINASFTLTVGARYYLDTTNGQLTVIPPTAAGNLQQSIGIALQPTALRFFTGPQIQH